MFVVCQSAKIIPDLYEAIACELMQGVNVDSCKIAPWLDYAVPISHLLLAINSSANFLIYIFRGEDNTDYINTQLKMLTILN